MIGPRILPPTDSFALFWTGLTSAPPPSNAGLTPPLAPTGAAPVAAVGKLLSLPANTYVFGMSNKGSHLYIRPCYELLLMTILELFKTDSGVLVTGIPGVGKVMCNNRLCGAE